MSAGGSSGSVLLRLAVCAAAGCGAASPTVEGGGGEVAVAEICEEVGIDPSRFWNDDARARIRAAHAQGTELDEGREEAEELALLGELVIARFEELVSALEHAAREACDDHRRGTIDGQTLESIARCLGEVHRDTWKALPAARRGSMEDSTRLVLGLTMGPSKRLEGCAASALAGGADPADAVELLIRGRAAAARGDIGEGLAFLERADALYSAAGDDLGRELVALEMGHVAAAAGMGDAALQMYSKAARYCRSAAVGSPARREAAIEAIAEVVRILEQSLGPEHPRTRTLSEALDLCAAGE